jgi:hypothetical protein
VDDPLVADCRILVLKGGRVGLDDVGRELDAL